MDNNLPTDFDLIVIGTGVVESIISAAASRIGKRVLQVDRNSYYGGHWASFNLEDIQNRLQEFVSSDNQDLKTNTKVYGENTVTLWNRLKNIPYFETEWHIPEKDESSKTSGELGKSTDSDGKNHQEQDEVCDNLDSISLDEVKIPESNIKEQVGFEKDDGVNKPDVDITTSDKEVKCTHKEMTQEFLMKQYKNFLIDLCPKLHFARGSFVELLISSNIARYTEFRSVSRVLTWINGHIEIVPCSRSDVFANNRVSVVEKRMLMKLLTSIEKEANSSTLPESTTYKDFLKSKKLSTSIIHFVLYALSMSTDQTGWLEGIKQTKRFLDSLGRYGKTPLLFSMFGSGELCQAFCRLSAVYGAVFALNQPLEAIELDEENKFVNLICGSQKIKADHLVMDIGMIPEKFLGNSNEKFISRGVFITDSSVMQSEKEHLSLMLYPTGDNLCFVLEVGARTGVCPFELYVVHITCRGISTPKEDLQNCVNDLFGINDPITSTAHRKPRILWSSYFSIPDTNELEMKSSMPSNIFVCPGPDLDLDLDFSVQKAREIFSSIYPGEEFLPRAPDADEIVIDEDAEVATEVKAVSSQVNISVESELKTEIQDSTETEVGIEAKASGSDLKLPLEDKVVQEEEGVEECSEAEESSN